MKKTIIILISIFFSIPLLSHDKEGWYWEPEIPLDGNSNGFVYRSDTLFTVVEDGVDTYMISSVDHGETWEEYIYYDWASEQGWDFGQTNPGEPILLNDSSIYVGNDSQFSFYELERGEKEFRHIRIDSSVRPGAFDQFDLNIGFATSGLSNHYLTRDGWRTVDSIPKGEQYTYLTYLEFINDSIIAGAILDWPAKQNSFGHYNIHTYQWNIYGTFENSPRGLRRFYTVNTNLIYATDITKDSGVGNQVYDIIYRSRDGGLTWENLLWDGADPGFGLQRIAFHDELNGFAVGVGGRIYMTNDGGETWDYADLVEEELAHPMEELYGPNGTIPAWSDTVPIFSGIMGVNYTYRGDFFNFDYEEITPTKLDLPADGSFLSSNKTLSWVGGESDPEYYHLQVTTSQRDYDRWLTLSVNERLQEKSFELSTLSPDSTYYWRVLTVKGSQIRESEIRSFTVWDEEPIGYTRILGCNQPEAYTTIVEPTLEIKWTKAQGANQYAFRVQTLYDESYILDTIVQDTNIIFTFPSEGIHHCTVVPQKTEDGIVVDSSWQYPQEYCSYMIDYKPPTHISEDCELQSLGYSDTLYWDHKLEDRVSKTRFYEVNVTEDTLGNVPSLMWGYILKPHISIQDLDNYSDHFNLKPDKQYWWRVKVTSTDYFLPDSDWSEYCSFTTAPWLSVEESDSDIKILSIDGALSVEGISSIETLVLIDVTGRTVLQSRTNTINTSSLSAGNYFLVINGTEYKKVVVQ